MSDENESLDSKMKAWIDNATYEQLLSKWRFAPVGSPWFRGAIGAYYSKVMLEKKQQLADGEHSAISKKIGW